MAEILEVVPRELFRFGDSLRAGAEKISALNADPQFEAAAAAMAGSELAGALGDAPGLTKAALAAVARRLRELSDVARGNARSYQEADSWHVVDAAN